MKLKQVGSFVLLCISLTGCTFSGGTEQSNSCSIWEDEYFTFLPTSNQMENPHGYFTEAVGAQNAFIGRLEGLSSPSAEEDDLIIRFLDATRNMQSAYVEQLEMLVPGQSRDEFLGGLSEAELEAWVADGEALASVTQDTRVILEEYAAFCAEVG